MSVDFSTFQMAAYGAKYIHSNTSNFKSIIQKEGFKSIDNYAEQLRKNFIELIERRIKLLENITMLYITKQYGNITKEEALKKLNDFYNAANQSKTLTGLGYKLKYYSTYFSNVVINAKKSGNKKLYLKYYQEQVKTIFESLEKYVNSLEKLILTKMVIHDKNSINAFYTLKATLDKAKEYVSEHKTIWVANDPSQYYELFQILRGLETTNDDVRKESDSDILFQNLKKQTENFEDKLLTKLSWDGALGIAREYDIADFGIKLLGKKFDEKQKGKYYSIGSQDNIKMRADTFLVTLETKNKSYDIGFNVKSYKGKGYMNNYNARDFLDSWKNSDPLSYSKWIYLNKNIFALDIWNNSMFGDIISESGLKKWKSIKVQSLEDYIPLLRKYQIFMSQIYSISGFLDGFLDFQKDNGFVPEGTKDGVKIGRGDYVHSIALVMNDRIFWTHDLLVEILNGIKKISLKNYNGKIELDYKGNRFFSTSSTLKSEENPFAGRKEDLAKLYRKKLRFIKKASGNYGRMLDLVNNSAGITFDDLNINTFDYVDKNYYFINPYNTK